MAVGKYSPTVTDAYHCDQSWHEKNCDREVHDGVDCGPKQYDRDGYDSYGYDKNDVDRAGINENDYMMGEHIGDDYVYPLYERIYSEWSYDKTTGKPVRK